MIMVFYISKNERIAFQLPILEELKISFYHYLF